MHLVSHSSEYAKRIIQKKKTLISMPGDNGVRAWEIRYPCLFVNYDVSLPQRQ